MFAKRSFVLFSGGCLQDELSCVGCVFFGLLCAEDEWYFNEFC